jgi:hypothetical protein
MNLMGVQHPSKPVTKLDKAMSKRHKKNRKMISKMKDKEEQAEASVHYNGKHEDEHHESGKMAKIELKKLKKVFKRGK